MTDSRSEPPEAALHIGANAGLEFAIEQGWMLAELKHLQRKNFVLLARAVLVAATERRKCPGCVVESGTDSSGERWVRKRANICRVCRGSGFLYVLKQSESE